MSKGTNPYQKQNWKDSNPKVFTSLLCDITPQIESKQTLEKTRH